jgi:carbon storage regulator
MLILSRKNGESILIDGQTRITILGSRGGKIRLGVEAPRLVTVLRGELAAQPPRPKVA